MDQFGRLLNGPKNFWHVVGSIVLLNESRENGVFLTEKFEEAVFKIGACTFFGHWHGEQILTPLHQFGQFVLGIKVNVDAVFEIFVHDLATQKEGQHGTVHEAKLFAVPEGEFAVLLESEQSLDERITSLCDAF